MSLTESQKVNLEWQAEGFDLPDYDEICYTLKSIQGENGLLLAFICNHCPYVKKIIDQLCRDSEKLQKYEINTVAIMSNDWSKYPDDSPDNMKEFAKIHKMNFPYLVDANQNIAKAYGAVCTPDFYGFDKSLKLKYRGRIHDPNKQISGNSDLYTAMKEVALSGTTNVKQFPSIGCSIKWKL